MMPMTSICDLDCSTSRSVLPGPDRDARPVSVVSAGVAHQHMRTAGDLVSALLQQRGTWQDTTRGAAAGLADLQELCASANITVRDARKLDRFSLLALAAAKAAIRESNLTADTLSTCGVFSGNMMGGWTFTEPQVRTLHRDGLDCVSPYLATAWFPGAPQGQISIHFGLTGFAKTIATDRCSGSQAVGMAYQRIRAGLEPGLFLAGGAEAPVTPFVAASLSQIMNHGTGIVEGAAYLLLSAGKSGAVQITGHSTFSLYPEGANIARQLVSRITTLFENHEIRPPDLVLCNIPLGADLEKHLCEAVRSTFGNRPQIFVTTRAFGDALAASGPLACVAACGMLTRFPHAREALVVSLGHQCGDLLLFSKTEEEIS